MPPSVDCSLPKTVINESVNSFNQEKLSQLWKTYTQEKNNLGENNIAALLEMSQPKLLENHKILLKTICKKIENFLLKVLLLSYLIALLFTSIKKIYQVKCSLNKLNIFINRVIII